MTIPETTGVRSFLPAAAPGRRRAASAVVGVAGMLVCVAAAATAEPTLDRVEPGGGPRAAELEIAIVGKELADPEHLWFEDGAIAVVSLTAVDDKRAKATIRIPADCPLGPHRLRLRTKHGLSDLRTFRVGQWPQTTEVEPNDDPRVVAKDAVPVGEARTISGVVKGEDLDCFPVRARAGERISVAIDGIRLDQEMFDPFVEIVDERGFVLASCDDHPLAGQDAMLAATAPTDGIYTIRVRESAYGGNDGCVYLLHVGRFPVPHVAWPPGGKPGAEMEIEWLGDPAGPFRTKAVLPARGDHAGLAEVRPAAGSIAAAVGVPLVVSSLPATPTAEPDDEAGKAGRVSAPAAIFGRLDAAEDVDWIRVEAPKGSAWRVRGFGRRVGSPIDLVLAAHRDNDKRERITSNDDTAGPDSELRLTAPDEGSFLLRISDHRRRGGPEFIYWVEIEPAATGVALSVPPGRSNSQQRLVAAVPRGNRTALLLNAARTDHDGPVDVAFDGLPSGVTVVTPPVAAKAPGTVAVFEAAADAPLAVSRARLVATSVATPEAAAAPLGGLRQETELVFGQPNNTAYRTSVSDRLPVAVVDAAPLRVEVDPPAVPLVRRGSMDLRVRILREEGFGGKVQLRFPFKPPGIGGPTTVEVGEKETEAVVPINATADAPLAEWQLVVTAAVKDKGEPSGWVSSRPTAVRVAEPMVELAAEKAAAEPGQETKIVCKVTKRGSFEGVAKARLMGLPTKAEAPELDLAADAEELIFPVRLAADATPGRHDNVFCQIRVPLAGSWVVHAMPATQLRIDKPLPKPKPPADDDAAAVPAAAAAPAVAKEGT